MFFNNFTSAVDVAQGQNLPLWDTHKTPERYYVGYITQDVKMQYGSRTNTWVRMQIFDDKHEKCLKQGDPLLQYLFNTVAQLNTRVAKLEDQLEFYTTGEIEDET